MQLVPLQVVFGEQGVLEGIGAGRGYVDMSTVDEQTSIKIHEAISSKGGRFLEVNGQGFELPENG